MYSYSLPSELDLHLLTHTSIIIIDKKTSRHGFSHILSLWVLSNDRFAVFSRSFYPNPSIVPDRKRKIPKDYF